MAFTFLDEEQHQGGGFTFVDDYEPPGKLQSAAGRYAQSLYSIPAGVLESIPVGGAALQRLSQKAEGLPLVGGAFEFLNQLPGFRDQVQPEERPLYKAGQAVRDFSADLFPYDPEKKGFFQSTLPSGAGSMVGFIAGGALGRAAKLPAYLGAATLGATAGGSESFREATEAGADEDDIYFNTLVNAGLGLFEAVPISRLLNQINRSSGGVLKDAIVQGSEELVQEVLQQYGSNLAAISTFDPTRDDLSGLVEGGAAGFTLGSLASLVASAIGGRRARGFRGDPAVESAAIENLGIRDRAGESQPIQFLPEVESALLGAPLQGAQPQAQGFTFIDEGPSQPQEAQDAIQRESQTIPRDVRQPQVPQEVQAQVPPAEGRPQATQAPIEAEAAPLTGRAAMEERLKQLEAEEASQTAPQIVDPSPKIEELQSLKEPTVDDVRRLFPGSTNRRGGAYDLGDSLSSVEQLESLAKARESMTKGGDPFGRVMMGQFIREAIERATKSGSAGFQMTESAPLDFRQNQEVADWLVKNADRIGLSESAVTEIQQNMPPEGAGDMVTLYIGRGGVEGGGQGQSWATANKQKAASFGTEVTEIQLTKSEAEKAKARARQAGQGGDTYFLTKEQFDKAPRSVSQVEAPVIEIDEPAVTESSPVGIAPEGSSLVRQAVEFFTPPTPSATPEIQIQHGARLPRLQNPATEKLLASTPHGMARVPVLGQLMDPRAKAHTPADVSLITRAYSVEKGKTLAALWASTQNRSRTLFQADESTGTITLSDGTKGYMSDVIEAELRKPGSQPLSQSQRDWINKEWIPLRKDVDRMLKDEGVTEIVDEEFEYKPSRDYFPRPAVGKRGLSLPGAGGTRPGARQFFEKGRIYKTEEEGARPPRKGEKKDQIIYDPNAVSRASKFMAGAYRAVADHRLANDPDLQGRTVEERYKRLVEQSEGLELLSDSERRDALRDLREQAARPSWIRERYVGAGPAFIGKIYPADVADRIERMFARDSSHFIQAAQSVTATSKAMLAVGDLSQFMIQGGAIAGAHPVIWAKAMKNSIVSLSNPDVVARLIEEPRMKKAAEEFTQSGGTLLRLQDFLAGARKGSPIESVPALGPVIQRLGHAYGAFLDMSKLYLWKSYAEATPRDQWGKLSETVENSVFMGRMESIGLNPGRQLAERLMLFAPSYYRGAGGLVTTALGGGVSGRVARRMIGGYAVAGLAMFASGAALLGLPPDEIEKRLNPRSGKFMMLPVPLGNNERVEAGFGNVLTQLFRLAFQSYGYHSEDQPIDTGMEGNPYVRFLMGRAAFLPSLASDIVTGKDYMGDRITIKEAISRRFIPFAIQAAFPGEDRGTYRQRSADAMFTFFGLRSFPENEFSQERRLMDDISHERYGKPFTELTLNQRSEAIARFKRSELWNNRTPTPSDMERFMSMAEGRRVQLQGDIDKSRIERLSELGLRVGPYRSTITVKKESVPLTREEQELYHDLLVDEYNRSMTDPLMNHLEKISLSDRETKWNQEQSKIRRTARQKLEAQISRVNE